MHKHVAPRRLPSPVVPVTVAALILVFIISALAVMNFPRPTPPATPPNAAPVSEPVTADPSAILTAQRVSVATAPAPEPEPTAPAPEPTAPAPEPTETVQAWTPEAPQIPNVPVGAPEVGVPLTEQTAVCEEDMPCWDCATMGNMVCGTIDDSAQAWAAWDANGGACLLDMDESRPFRVDYSASTPEYPQNMTATDVAVQGADGTWYVFTANYTDVPEETSDFEEPADMS